MLDVLVLGPEGALFEGKTRHIILPGEMGVFEVHSYHRPILTRLLSGRIVMDGQALPIRRGVVKVERNHVVALVEPP